MRIPRAWVVGLSLVAAGTLGVTSAHAACTKDVECEGEQVCEAGQCVQPVTAAAPATAPEVVAPPPDPAARYAMRSESPSLHHDPPPLDPNAPPYKRRNRGMMTTGIVLTALGTLTLGIVIVDSEKTSCTTGGDPTSCRTRPNYEAWLGTALLLGAGIPMIVVGGQKVPNLAAPRAALGPWLSPHSAGLALRLAL